MFFSESNAAWVACVVSACALALSLYRPAKSRNSRSLSLGSDQDGNCIRITNNSPRAVTIVDLGVVRRDGVRISVLREDVILLRKLYGPDSAGIL